ncbi:MAG TPA: PKD domain-containing protein [Syntrophales bacterium]|nr:PKD domain-containing protein [Syntrophales bacterium]
MTCYNEESGSVEGKCNYVTEGSITYYLTATANEGYTFSRWEGEVSSTNQTVSITLPATADSTTKSFKAIFVQRTPMPPVADAGADQTVESGTTVTLDGSGSSDSDGTIFSYSWEQLSGTGVALSDNNAQKPTFTAPNVAAGSTAALTFRLRVFDDEMMSGTDTVTITVGSSNEAPTANAGADQSVLTGATVTLNGTGSSDPEGGALTYAWTQLSGTEVTLSDPAAVSPTFTAPDEAGTLVFQLTVTDGYQASDTDTVTITVSVPSASAAYRLYYPHVVSQLSAGGGKVWETDIVVVYTGTEESFTGTLLAYDASGAEVGTAVPVTLASMGRVVYPIGATFESPDTIRYIVLESEQDGAVGYELIGVDGLARTTFEAYLVSNDTSGDTEYQPPIVQSRASSAVPSSSGVFMTLDQTGWTGIVFVNPGDAEVTVELKAYNDDGEEIATDSFDLAAGGYRSGFASGFFLVKGALEGATHITYSAGGDVIAVQFSGDYSGAMLDSLPGA